MRVINNPCHGETTPTGSTLGKEYSMNNVSFFDPHGNRINSIEEFIYKSSDVWVDWGYPSVDTLHLTAMTGLKTWERLSEEPSYCFCTVNGQNVFYFSYAFGQMLMGISGNVDNFFRNNPKSSKKDDLYFLQDISTGYIKIGRSNNPERRLKSLQIGSSGKLTLLRVLKGMGAKEKELHMKFCNYHVHGEWYKPNEAIIRYMNNL